MSESDFEEADIVAGLTKAIKARRRLIRKDDDKIRSLEKIEALHRSVEEKHKEFKELLDKSDKNCIDYIQRLNKDINYHKQTISNLREYNKNLHKLNLEQCAENEKLKSKLDEVIQRL